MKTKSRFIHNHRAMSDHPIAIWYKRRNSEDDPDEPDLILQQKDLECEFDDVMVITINGQPYKVELCTPEEKYHIATAELIEK